MTTLPSASPPRAARSRWFNRRRVLALLVTLAVLAPVGVRWIRLGRMPVVPVPFDVGAFGAAPLSEQGNAFDFFQQAGLQLQRSSFEDDYWNRQQHVGAELTWEHVPAAERAWVEQHAAALELYRRGGRCTWSEICPPDQYVNDTLLLSPFRHQLGQRFPCLAYLAGLRHLHAGDSAAAADVLHDAFRATRLLGQRGSFDERNWGVQSHAVLTPGWHVWSRDSRVTAEALEAALERLRADWKLTPPPSDQFKVAFLIVENETKLPRTYPQWAFDAWIESSWSDTLDSHQISVRKQLATMNAHVPNWQVPLLWVMGEPELTRRAARLWLTHELKTCDLPLVEQPPDSGAPFWLADSDDLTAGWTGSELNRRLNESFLANYPVHHIWLSQRVRDEAGRQAVLETEMQLQLLFRRSHATTRAEREQVMTQFSWPLDPCSRAGQPIQHRLADEGLMIWSRGHDGIDHDGIRSDHADCSDIAVTIPWEESASQQQGE